MNAGPNLTPGASAAEDAMGQKMQPRGLGHTADTGTHRPLGIDRHLLAHNGAPPFFAATPGISADSDLLRASQERLQLATEAAELGIHDYDIVSSRITWDARVRALWGIPEPEPITMDTFLAGLHPDDRAAALAAVDRALDPRGSGTYRAEYRVRSRADGVERWVAATGRVVFRDDQPVRLVGTVQDITKLRHAEAAAREAEQRFRTMAEGLPHSIWVTDPAGEIQFINQAYCDFFGVSEHAVRTGGWQPLVHPEDRDFYVSSFFACMAERRPFRCETRVRAADGAWRTIESFGQPRFSERGRFLGMVGASVDITERRELELARAALLESERAARSAAERVALMKDEFLATISHELRTPLNAIVGWAQLLNRGTLDAQDTREALVTIEINARLQQQLIEDLLEMSRFVSGKFRLNVQPLDLRDVVLDVVKTLMPEAQVQRVRVRVFCATESVEILGDPRRIQQIIINLLSNALKFTPAGGRVSLAVRMIAARAFLLVKDTGVGIAPDYLEHLFERFRQADPTSTRKHRGLGLGLALVKQLVEAHGGTVVARSAGVGRGARFFVYLPLKRHSDPQSLTAMRFTDLSGVRVLLVDDEPSALSLASRVLEEGGAQVTGCSSAADALAELHEDEFDVLVSDLSMPVEDGYALVRRVRQLAEPRRAHLPAIALTAFARALDRDRALEAGFQEHLPKPVDPAALCGLVSKLARRQARL